ncbi:hypothetical protein H0H81_009111 [Sphagnurus paluster]|uniref:Ras GEF n=1 Tax=Sphagnurus paluster TaxID=117069 RepID=A0A9P7GPW5_9AGAR|nr:hypothetical protein H0H81_009111 [Sphagnurus paluster]
MADIKPLQFRDDEITPPDMPLAANLLMTTNDPVDPPVDTESTTSPAPIDPVILPITALTTPSILSDIIGETRDTELGATDITVAPDGSFVETPSGPAARELKRFWDQKIGVGKSVRSPYAITAFVNQHGKQMFRVGRRELSAPAANAAEIEERITQSSTPSEPSNSPRNKRRSRMSVHAFPAMFKNGSVSSGSRSQALPRKLRKTRSIPDMVSSTNDTSSPTTAGSATGRVHSRSVTGADVSPFSTVVRNPNPGDIFGEVMDWGPPSTPASFSSTHLSSTGQSMDEIHDHFKSPTIITHPFGHGVTYDSPSRKPAEPLLPLPRHLREVQSFESGLTARQIDLPKHQSSGLGLDSYLEDFNPDRPPSALRINPSDSGTPTSTTPEITPSPAPEPTLLSRYPTDVFDVLQTYRGLPLLEKLSFQSEETTVIKLSLSADESAAPRDDPRFVIWGEIQLDREQDDQSVSHESVTDLSVNSSSISRRRTSRAAAKAPPTPSTRVSVGETQKVLIAATIERWIAQLTSDLNYDELLDFFLTYRAYVSAVDLCHLLIARFHWALQASTSPRDERVRRIVRVRTFVAIRYWLLTFFTVDFLPNRELRLLVAEWLNTLVRDPILKEHTDGLGIVRKLIKVSKECKQAHTRTSIKSSKPRTSLGAKAAPAKKSHVLGDHFAAATRADEDSDLDLDFLPEEGAPPDSAPGFPHDIANAHLSTAHVGTGSLSPTRPTSSIPFSSFSILHSTEHAPGSGEPEHALHLTPATLPIHHGVLSRAFVKTIGRLGRWKRVLNSRNTTRPSINTCADVSAFDIDLMGRDVLAGTGGVEGYLKALGPPATTVDIPLSAVTPPVPTTTGPRKSFEHVPVAVTTPAEVETITLDRTEVETIPIAPPPKFSEPEKDLPPGHAEVAPSEQADPSLLSPTSVDQDNCGISVRSSTSTDSFGEPLTTAPTFPAVARSQWQFDIVSIDDLDLSDTSSEHHHPQQQADPGPSLPPGLRRPPRRLPLRREFEFVRRSLVSSMGLTSRGSVTSNSSSHPSSDTSAIALGGNVAQWQLNALIDSLSDDEETGDVEDALRRLEGQINPQKQQEKTSKVDGWIRTIQERMAAGDYEDEQPLFSDDEEFGEEQSVAAQEIESEQGIENFENDSATPVSESEDSAATDEGRLDHLINTPIPTQINHVIKVPSGPGSPTRSTDAKPALEDVVPLEILQSRVPTLTNNSNPRPSTSSGFTHTARLSLSRFVAGSEVPRAHRSFILNHRAADLAEHFAMIDRELLMGVKFEELVLEDWMSCKEVDVLDWAQYLKDRARWKVENRYPDKTSALGAVRARFNLMANFTISEIVLTRPHERPVLVAKFIRIAWKAYRMCNFSTLVAIIAGLGSEWVTKAMKKPGWHRVGIWENRMFKDLKVFARNTDDFVYIRQTVASIVDVKPLDASSHAASVVSGGGTDTQSGKGKAGAERPVMPSACIPFIGVYLSQLQRHSRLPDLIDPTAPDEAVSINPVTANFDAPAHPEVFSALTPLPPSMHLEPLINVHKQRRIAGVIKSLVAGQHLASRVQFDIDKKLFQRCLRLRALNADMRQRVLSMYPE